MVGRNDRSSHNRVYIKTGSQELDELFGGNGIETKAITQFYGQSATGKTQLCHTLCVTVQQLQTNYKTLYLDTEGTFRSERIAEIAKARGLDPNKALQNVRCIQPLNSARLESILQQDLPLQLNQENDIKLISNRLCNKSIQSRIFWTRNAFAKAIQIEQDNASFAKHRARV